MSTENNNCNNIPRHVAIIMDGNGRWAQRKRLPRIAGHKAGVEAVRGIVQICASSKIEALTLFAFSSENWRRPEKEVGLLMDLFISTMSREVKKLHQNNVQLRIIGERKAFSEKLQKSIAASEEMTRENTGLKLVVAANYGGRWDIIQAAKKMCEEVIAGNMSIDAMRPEQFEKYISLSELPEPDLFIRTGGEQRISNFLLWQLAYTELYFTETLWPDFNKQAFQDALMSFSQRQRRFGQTGEQVEQLQGA